MGLINNYQIFTIIIDKQYMFYILILSCLIRFSMGGVSNNHSYDLYINSNPAGEVIHNASHFQRKWEVYNNISVIRFRIY